MVLIKNVVYKGRITQVQISFKTIKIIIRENFYLRCPNTYKNSVVFETVLDFQVVIDDKASIKNECAPFQNVVLLLCTFKIDRYDIRTILFSQ